MMMDVFFKNKNYWAIILGGSSGIGLAIAQKMGEQGMNLCIVHRDRKKEQEVFYKKLEVLKNNGIEILTINADALMPEKRTAILETLTNTMHPGGKVKLLVHAISRGNLKLLVPTVASQKQEQLSETEALYQRLKEDINSIFQDQQATLSSTDFQNTIYAMGYSLYDWVKECHNKGLFSTDARVLGLTSEGSQKAWRSYAAVSAAKATLEAVGRSIALEFAAFGVRCNILQPGVTKTPSLGMIPGSEHLIENAKMRNPFQRLTRPEDVADVVYLLSRPESSWINGAIIPVDGGESKT